MKFFGKFVHYETSKQAKNQVSFILNVGHFRINLLKNITTHNMHLWNYVSVSYSLLVGYPNLQKPADNCHVKSFPDYCRILDKLNIRPD